MTYRGHLTGGVLTAVLTVHLAPAPAGGPLLWLAILATLVGALAPDLDMPGSFLSRRLGPIQWITRGLFSNPLTWYLAGFPLVQRTEARRPRTIPWLFRLVYNPVTRTLCGDEATLRTTARLIAGRARLRKALGHRALSHSLVGMTVATMLVGVSVLLLAWYAAARWHQPTWLTPLLRSAPRPPASPGAWWPWYAPSVGHITLGFLLGYASHILLDLLTVSGVPLLLPYTPYRFHLLPPGLRVRSS